MTLFKWHDFFHLNKPGNATDHTVTTVYGRREFLPLHARKRNIKIPIIILTNQIYLSTILIAGVTRLLGEEMAIKRDHPLTMRRYMWKLEY